MKTQEDFAKLRDNSDRAKKIARIERSELCELFADIDAEFENASILARLSDSRK